VEVEVEAETVVKTDIRRARSSCSSSRPSGPEVRVKVEVVDLLG
jgi:hypothetical protein